MYGYNSKKLHVNQLLELMVKTASHHLFNQWEGSGVWILTDFYCLGTAVCYTTGSFWWKKVIKTQDVKLLVGVASPELQE